MIVITGATGNVGRPLVQILSAAGEAVVPVSRRGEGHQVDLTKPETLKPALDGADAVFLLTAADFLANGNMQDVVDVVRASGVQRVVLLSSQGVGTQRHPSNIEDAVKESGLDWTMLRPGNFASNAFQWAESVRTQRLMAAPFADVALPAVDPDDIAAVAAVALREPGHAGHTYTLTGPAATRRVRRCRRTCPSRSSKRPSAYSAPRPRPSRRSRPTWRRCSAARRVRSPTGYDATSQHSSSPAGADQWQEDVVDQ